jgi:hypothetical protein
MRRDVPRRITNMPPLIRKTASSCDTTSTRRRIGLHPWHLLPARRRLTLCSGLYVRDIHSASQLPGKKATQPYAPDLLDQAERRILRPSLAARPHRRATPHKSCPAQLAPATAGERSCVCGRGRASYRQQKPARGVFWTCSSNPIGSAGRFSGGLPLAHASTKSWQPLSVCSRKGFFYFCTFLHSEAQRQAESNQRKPQC